ncbi:hypothetical protein [Gallaecimonas sp. GXIMD4217]|uniref:hypothetical protein n=1 Tax=Gallaecimonas sp. GXIMD4217 TaxID=3131927 RepID=UPI00311B2E02
MFYKSLNGIGRIVAIDEADDLVTIKDLNNQHTFVAHMQQLDPSLLLDERMLWESEDQ